LLMVSPAAGAVTGGSEGGCSIGRERERERVAGKIWMRESERLGF